MYTEIHQFHSSAISRRNMLKCTEMHKVLCDYPNINIFTRGFFCSPPDIFHNAGEFHRDSGCSVGKLARRNNSSQIVRPNDVMRFLSAHAISGRGMFKSKDVFSILINNYPLQR